MNHPNDSELVTFAVRTAKKKIVTYSIIGFANSIAANRPMTIKAGLANSDNSNK